MKRILQFLLLIALLALSFFAEEKLQGIGRCQAGCRSRSLWEKVFGEARAEPSVQLGTAGIRGDGTCRSSLLELMARNSHGISSREAVSGFLVKARAAQDGTGALSLPLWRQPWKGVSFRSGPGEHLDPGAKVHHGRVLCSRPSACNVLLVPTQGVALG